MKKLAIAITVLSLVLLLNPVLVEALDLSGEFTFGSSYDFEEENHLQKMGELELNFRRGTFSEAFNIDVVLENTWPENELKIGLDEAYFEYYGPDYDLRVGKQLVSWGTASGYNPTDNINAPDLEDPTGDKEPLVLTRGDYYFGGNYRLTGVLVPYHSPPLTGELLVDAEDMSADDPPADQVMIDIAEPEYDLSTVESALKFSGRNIEGFDFSVSAYHGHEKMPTLNKEEREIEGDPTDPDKVIVPADYQRLIALGADLVTDYEGIGLWAEGVYMKPEAGDEYGSLVLGADYHLETGQLLLGQVIYHKDREAEDNYLLQSAVEGNFGDYHDYQLAGFANLTTEEYLVRPEVTISLADAVNLDLEYTYQSGEVLAGQQSFLAPERNELAASVSYSF